MPTMIDLYQRKVREIALSQCRCETGTDLDRPTPEQPEEARAA